MSFTDLTSSDAYCSFYGDNHSNHLAVLWAQIQLWHSLLQVDDNRCFPELSRQYCIPNLIRENKFRVKGSIRVTFEIGRPGKSYPGDKSWIWQDRRERLKASQHWRWLLFYDNVRLHETLQRQIHDNTRAEIDFLRKRGIRFRDLNPSFGSAVLWFDVDG